MVSQDSKFMAEAIKEAKKSLKEGGIPIGAVLVKDGTIVGRGHNRLIQNDSAILHGEMDCIENAGRLKGTDYKKCTLYTTLSPCTMCSGAVLLYNIPRVVIGENTTLLGSEKLLKRNGIEVTVMQVVECRKLLKKFIEENKETWETELEKVGFSTD
ncbi:MAG: nucleoside deaminase [Methanobacterium sp.]|jgi:tRNA(Arg) A34 adenosine deaminase TadA|uniref:nucleoside deaminase n=1 Tax=Methanobacterium sp. MZD130B TaxID=3394378 RepID=UPI00175E2BE9|nr:nucleoside deaminase [Methanobacterium sp.]